jgi:hypothetical protein
MAIIVSKAKKEGYTNAAAVLVCPKQLISSNETFFIRSTLFNRFATRFCTVYNKAGGE